MHMKKKIHTRIAVAVALLCVIVGVSSAKTPEQALPVSTPQVQSQTPPPVPVALPVSEPKTNPVNSDLEVSYIDVGQADSILITNNGEAMLVDAGTSEASDDVIGYLNGREIETLKYVVGTHPHEDHIGGMAKVLNTYDVGTVLMPAVVNNTKTFENVLNAIEAKDIPTEAPAAGTIYKVGNATVSVLSCLTTDDLNNSSIVLKLTYGKNSYLLQGDAENEAEQAILNSGVDLKCDVIKLGHHGSSTSSSDAYLAAADPDIAIISCGVDNQYGHPHTEITDKLTTAHIESWRTDTDGTIVITSNGTNYAIHSGNKTEPIQHIAGAQAAKAARDAAVIAEQERLAAEAAQEAARVAAEQQAAEEAAAKAAAEKAAQEAAAEQQQTNSQTVYVTKTGAKYHRSGCQYLKKSKIAISLDNAKSQGYTACSKCW